MFLRIVVICSTGLECGKIRSLEMNLFLQLECIEFKSMSMSLMRLRLGEEENWESE